MVAIDETRPVQVAGVQAKRVPRYDGLRGLACVALLVTHVSFFGNLIGSYDSPPSNQFLANFVNGLPVSLGIFFTLSGMFLYRSFARSTIAGTPRPELGPYFVRRALRLLPAYYVLVVVTFLVLSLNQIDSVWYVVRPFLLLQNYDPAMWPGLQITWTVVTEVHYYLLLPVIAWASHRWARSAPTPRARARRLLTPVPFMIAIGFAWAVYTHLPSMGPYPAPYWWPVGNIGVLGVGMTLAVWSALAATSPQDTPGLFRVAARHPGAFWAGAFALYLVNCFLPFSRPGYGDYLPMSSALIQQVLFLTFPVLIIAPMVAPGTNTRLIDAVLTNRPVRFIGTISYGVYLWHFAVAYLILGSGSIFGTVAAEQLRDRWPAAALVPAVLVGSIAVAAVSYYALERPLMNLGERRIARAKARRAARADGAVSVTG